MVYFCLWDQGSGISSVIHIEDSLLPQYQEARTYNLAWQNQTNLVTSPRKSTATGTFTVEFSSGQFSRSVVSDSLRPHEPQHARPPCPSPTPGVHPDLCPWSQWCHPTISSCVIPFSSCPQSFPASSSGCPEKVTEKGAHSSGFCGPTDTSDKISPPASHRSSSPPPPPPAAHPREEERWNQSCLSHYCSPFRRDAEAPHGNTGSKLRIPPHRWHLFHCYTSTSFFRCHLEGRCVPLCLVSWPLSPFSFVCNFI